MNALKPGDQLWAEKS